MRQHRYTTPLLIVASCLILYVLWTRYGSYWLIPNKGIVAQEIGNEAQPMPAGYENSTNTWGCAASGPQPPVPASRMPETNPFDGITPPNTQIDQSIAKGFKEITIKHEPNFVIAIPKNRIDIVISSQRVQQTLQYLMTEINMTVNGVCVHPVEVVVMKTTRDPSNIVYFDMRLVIHNTIGYGFSRMIDALVLLKDGTYYVQILQMTGYEAKEPINAPRGVSVDEGENYQPYSLPRTIEGKLDPITFSCLNENNLMCRQYPKQVNIQTKQAVNENHPLVEMPVFQGMQYERA